MFCCPYPRDSSLEPVRVPLIARAQGSVRTQLGLSDFTTALTDEIQHVISRKDVQLEDNNAAAMSLFARAFASVIESLLFFGLASEALGQKIKHEDFVTLSKDGCAEKTIEARIPEW
ncbi:hypothetical protein IFR04_013985 [Cadophora malorum]|uniref:Uncharacterized protein n=1 Tax=Cadophora malorum TaxID=108018 RepID=A0A8H7T4K4_9HELO|nr:hypothetical protein IFR04_013985 [Cadophora malorum]